MSTPEFIHIDGDFFSTMKMTEGRTVYAKEGMDVIEATWDEKEKTPVAIKRVFLLDGKGRHRRKKVEKFIREFSLLGKCQHPHIIKQMGSAICPKFAAYWMPFYSTGTLRTLRESMEPKQIERCFIQVACAVRYLHSNNVVHGDIKASNILLDEDCNAFLADFDHAFEKTPESQQHGWGGTHGYIGPEFYDSKEPFDPYLMDAYALGATLWSMVFQDSPGDWDLLDALQEEGGHLPDTYK